MSNHNMGETRFPENRINERDYGFSSQNPIMTASVSDSRDYLARLQTADGLPLEWERLRSVYVKELYGIQDAIVDEYQLAINGDNYRKIYIYPNGENDSVAPRGMMLEGKYDYENNPSSSATIEERDYDYETQKDASLTFFTDSSDYPDDNSYDQNKNDDIYEEEQSFTEEEPLSEKQDNTEKESDEPRRFVEVIKCYRCQSPIRKDANYCRLCGACNAGYGHETVVNSLSSEDEIVADDGDKHKSLKRAAITILVLAILGGIGWGVSTISKKDKKRNEQKPKSYSFSLVQTGDEETSEKANINTEVTNVVIPQSEHTANKEDDTTDTLEENKSEADKKSTESAISTSMKNFAGDMAVYTNDYQVGKIIILGRYEQDNNLQNGPEPLEWVVISKNEDSGYVGIVTRYVIDAVTYGRSNDVWGSSNIRKWLNEDFYNNAFNENEKSNILTTAIKGTNGEVQVRDYVFLLSSSETKKYLSEGNKYRLGIPTEFARSIDGFSVSSDGTAAWRTRDPNKKIGQTGKEEKTSANVAMGIRPAVYIKTDSSAGGK